MTIDAPILLMLFALGWVLLACVLGLIQGVKHTSHLASLEELAGSGDLAAYHRHHIAFRQATNTHTHAMLFALLSLAVGLMLHMIEVPPTQALIATVALIGATVTWTIGGVLDIKAVKGAGDFLLMGGVALALWSGWGVVP